MNTHDKKANQDALRNVYTLLECAGAHRLQAVVDSETGTRLEDGMYQFSFDGNAYTVAMHSSTGQWYLGSVTARVNGALHVLPAAIAELREMLLPRPLSGIVLNEPLSADDWEGIRKAWHKGQRAQLQILKEAVLGVRVDVDATLPPNSIQILNKATGERVTLTNIALPKTTVTETPNADSVTYPLQNTSTPPTHFERVISELASEDSDFVERIRQALAGNGDE